jgi:hypothetical protein
VADVGSTVQYRYCGENTSDVDLEVVRVVDDRLGVLEVPEESTIVSPGETLCNTDLGLPVSYVVEASDAGTTIVNNAVVTVRTTGVDAQAFQAADPAEVEVPTVAAPTTTTVTEPIPATGSSGLPAQTLFALFAIGSGSLLLVLAGRRKRA